MHVLAKSLCTLALAAFAAGPALAETGSFVANFGALAIGKITTLSPGHLFWTGSFSGVLFDAADGPMNNASVTCPSTNDLDFNAGTGKIAGYCLISDGESSIVASYTCSGAPGTCEGGTASWGEGTGKWAGWTADVTFSGYLGKTLEDGSVPTHAIWNVNYTTP